MRIYEFAGDSNLDKFIVVLKNVIGSHSKKQSPAPLNWAAVAEIAKKSGFEVMSDQNTGYETFKSLWDTNPQARTLLEPMVKNFNANGLELKVPGAPDAEQPEQGGETSQDAVDKIAASAAPQQLAQATA
jgi:hypothetical protein